MSYRDVFTAFDRNGLTYVVPRRYDNLPADSIDGGDVDVVLAPDDYRAAVDCCRSLGFSEPDDTGGRLRLYQLALAKPQKAASTVASEPKESVLKVLTGNRTTASNPRHRNVQLTRGAQMVDLQSNLAYRSPLNGSKIPVDPDVTTGMLSRRRRTDCFYTPTPPDELAHLVPHCVFDKEGEFPQYYVDRCDELFAAVRADEEQLSLFRTLLSRIFYRADRLVFDLVAEGRYADIRRELRKFSDY